MLVLAAVGGAVDAIGRQEVSVSRAHLRLVACSNFRCRPLMRILHSARNSIVVWNRVSSHVVVSGRQHACGSSSFRTICSFELLWGYQTEEDASLLLWPNPFRWHQAVFHPNAHVWFDRPVYILVIPVCWLPSAASS